MNIAEQIVSIRLNIDQLCAGSNRATDQVRLLAVSKTHPARAVQVAAEQGVTEFGESYLQEALAKIEALKGLSLIWHFIGPLQSNKTKLIAENFDWVQSVDREKIILRLAEQRPADLKPLQICIQANLFDEKQKKGVNSNQLEELLEITSQQSHVKLRGLMVIPPKQTSFNKQMAQFEMVFKIYNQLKTQYPTMDTLSMGMSDDMAAAIKCGSNMIRVGTAIFGVRGNTQQ